jgi:hypothetical protein
VNGCVLWLLGVLRGVPMTVDATPQGQRAERAWPSCGVAVVYAALKLLDRPVPLDTLQAACRALRPGVRLDRLSLADLRLVLQRHGVRAQALRVAASDELPVPAILYIRPERLNRRSLTGHFVLLRHADGSAVELVDVTATPRVLRMRRDELFVHWDGELLAMGPQPLGASFAWRRLGLAGALLAVAVLSGRVGWRLWRLGHVAVLGCPSAGGR